MKMRRVIVESPYRGKTIFDRWKNIRYARKCIRDCLKRGESPIASHLLYTQRGILNDDLPEERRWGMTAGWEWMEVADAIVVYTDRGVSGGMHSAIMLAETMGYKIEYRSLTDTPKWVISDVTVSADVAQR